MLYVLLSQTAWPCWCIRSVERRVKDSGRGIRSRWGISVDWRLFRVWWWITHSVCSAWASLSCWASTTKCLFWPGCSYPLQPWRGWERSMCLCVWTPIRWNGHQLKFCHYLLSLIYVVPNLHAVTFTWLTKLENIGKQIQKTQIDIQW